MRPASDSTKRTVIESLLAAGGRTFVRLDARTAGCVVPPHLATDHALALGLGYNLTPAIYDLTVDDAGISATLSFRGVSHHCVIPWGALYAAHAEGRSAEGVFWPASLPAEVRCVGAVEPKPTVAEEKARKRAHLKLVN